MDIDIDYLGQTIENAIANGMRTGAQMAFGEGGVSPIVTANMPPPIDLRDFFAGCVMAGLLGGRTLGKEEVYAHNLSRHEYCYAQADHLLAARKTKTPDDETPHA